MIAKDRLPGQARVCQVCKGEFVFARTVAGPNGPGGKAMPLDIIPNPDGNVAVRQLGAGRLVCRVLGTDDAVDETEEVRAMPHFATCGKNFADGIESWLRSATEGASS